MPQTNAYTRGVKYIKIAKLDSGSVDQSNELQNLTDIRIKFSDIPNVTQYNVGAINEYPTYYLYTIVPTDVTSSIDQEILDYKVSGSTTTGTSVSPTTIRLNNFSINTNTLNYFTASSGTYTLGNTPNVILSVTSSVNVATPAAGCTVYFSQLDSNGSSISTLFTGSFTATAGVANGTFSGSFTPIEGSNYGMFLQVSTFTGLSYTINLLVTQSVSPQSSTYDITVLEPYVGENFYNSDCNVLQNNVDVNVISPLYMDVDFTNSPIVAQNQASILNGTAARAQVQSWNYSYFSNISGRYLGKQQNAIAINIYTSASQFTTPSVNGFTGSWPGDTTSPSIPVPGNIIIQSLDSCIYEVNWGGGGYPENTNGGGISMGNIYLVGETKDDVTIIKPGTDIYYDLLAKMFPSGSTAYQYQYSNVSGLPNLLNITYPALGLPGASYYLASNGKLPRPGSNPSSSYQGYFYPTGALAVTNPFIYLYGPALISYYNISKADINNSGYLYQVAGWGTGSASDSVTLASLIQNMSSSISQGSRWFISLYSGSGTSTTLTSGLPPVASGILNQYGYAFEVQTAYTSSDIFGNAGSNYGYILFKTGSNIYDVASWFSGSTILPLGMSASVPSTGMLITKADTPTNGLTIYGVPSLNFAGTGQGYILSQYPKKVITENIDYITKTYGNNPN